ncbi:MAG: hypothetical protein F2648_01740 [Actinobacteria bacterium]|nr:hypothetical protein [Actinomycetota bacterium]MSZ17752.1 hypothetical protein [Actinomycetota bacterium]
MTPKGTCRRLLLLWPGAGSIKLR